MVTLDKIVEQERHRLVTFGTCTSVEPGLKSVDKPCRMTAEAFHCILSHTVLYGAPDMT